MGIIVCPSPENFNHKLLIRQQNSLELFSIPGMDCQSARTKNSSKKIPIPIILQIKRRGKVFERQFFYEKII
jgi:hypothetical protein